MAICTFLRNFLFVAIALFLMLSGRLCIRRKWTRGYLWGLAPVLTIWVLCSILCLLFRMLWLHEPMSVPGMLRRMLDYTADPYGWYIEMYIGLYLLMPLLNAAWNAMDLRARKGTLFSLLALTFIPTVTNLEYKLLPAWWTMIYPIAYYLLGAWLGEHPPKLRAVWLWLLWIAAAAASTALAFHYVPEGFSEMAEFAYWGGLFPVTEAFCAYVLLGRCTGERVPGILRRLVEILSRLSLPAYLLSYLFDTLLYPPLIAREPSLPLRMRWHLPMTAAILLCSCLLAFPVDRAASAIVRLLPKPEPPEITPEVKTE